MLQHEAGPSTPRSHSTRTPRLLLETCDVCHQRQLALSQPTSPPPLFDPQSSRLARRQASSANASLSLSSTSTGAPLFDGPTTTYSSSSRSSLSSSYTYTRTSSNSPYSPSPSPTYVPGVLLPLTVAGDSDDEAVYAVQMSFEPGGLGTRATRAKKRRRALRIDAEGRELQVLNMQVDLGSSDMVRSTCCHTTRHSPTGFSRRALWPM